jgi:hypothetical protein
MDKSLFDKPDSGVYEVRPEVLQLSKEVILALFETMPILKKPFCDLETEEGIDANIDILQEKSIKTV